MSIEDLRNSNVDGEHASHEMISDVHETAGHEDAKLPEVERVELAQAQSTPQVTDQTQGSEPSPKTDRVEAAPPAPQAAANPNEIVPDQNNVAHLAANVSLDDIRIEGANLVLVQPDGTEIVIVNGAAHVPTFLLGDVELPRDTVIAALNDSHINVAAGPDGGDSASAAAPSSGAEFQDTTPGGDDAPTELAALLADTQQLDGGPAGGEELRINHAPTIEPMESGLYVDTENDDEFKPIEGVVPGRDIDQNDALRYGVEGGQPLAGDPNYDIVKVGTYGELRLSSATGAYVFTPNDAAIEGLKDHQAESFTFTVTDKSGASGTQVWTVDINGTNDIAEISGEATGAVVEDGKTGGLATEGPQTFERAEAPANTISAEGQLTVSDRDTGDDHFQTPSSEALTGKYGNFSFDPATGKWSYVLNNESAAVQGLRAGEVEHETLTVTSADGTATQVIDVRVFGTNDAPVITGGTNPTAVIELTDASHQDIGGVTGTLTVTDADVGDTLSGSVTGDATAQLNGGALPEGVDVKALIASGAITFSTATTDGGSKTLTWTYDPKEANLDWLAKGETLTITYNAQVNDGSGNVGSQPITITITGTNDAPVVAADTNSVKAAGFSYGNHFDWGAWVANGNVLSNDHDLDHGDKLTVTGVSAGTSNGADVSGQVATKIIGIYGSLTMQSDGSYKYDLNNADADTRALAKDEHGSDVFTYTVTDKYGASTTTTLTIDVTGQNNRPDANNDFNTGAAIVESGVGPNNGPVAGVSSAKGNVLTNDTDVDHDDTKTVVGVSAGESRNDNDVYGRVGSVISGKYGTVSINADGSWTYKLDNSNSDTQSLRQGEHAEDIFTYTIKDANGATSTATLTIDITGTNDKAQIWGDSSGSVKEDNSVWRGDLVAGGDLDIRDVDAGESRFKTQSDTKGDYGSFSIDANGHWTYAADNSQLAIQQLGAGSKLTETFTVWSKDGSASQAVTVTIYGTNDVPTISGQNADSVKEDNDVDRRGNLVANGDLKIVDIDTNESQFKAQTSAAGKYGSFSIDANGHWTYTADNSQQAIQQLGAGSKLTETFTVWSKDGSASQVVTVTINGTNDIPTISGDKTDWVKEDSNVYRGNLVAHGDLNIRDVDTNESQFKSQTNAAGKYGSFTIDADGHWTYTADNSQLAIQQLGADSKLTETFTVLSKDGSASQAVTVTIYGTNDAPVIENSHSAGSVVELGYTASGERVGDAVVSDTLVKTDVDIDDNAGNDKWSALANKGQTLQGATVVGTYGTFSVDQDGKWTYTLDDNRQATQELNLNQTVTETFTVQVKDSHNATDTQQVVVTITGSNDKPVISGGETSGSVVEAGVGVNGQFTGGDASDSGVLKKYDVDAEDDASNDKWSVVVPGHPTEVAVTSVDGVYGSFSVDQDGKWTYNLNNSLTTTQALGRGQTDTEIFYVQVADKHGATATEVVKVTVTGTNDAPVAADDVYTTSEDTTLKVQAGTGVLANDTDAEHNTLNAILVSGPAHGTLTLNADGSFEYKPTTNYYGEDSFTYKPNDGMTDGAPVVVKITVGSVEDHVFTDGGETRHLGDFSDNQGPTSPDNPYFEDNNYLDAKGGDDTVFLPDLKDGLGKTYADLYAAGGIFNGGDGNDKIYGGDLDDRIAGGAGNDTIDGGTNSAVGFTRPDAPLSDGAAAILASAHGGDTVDYSGVATGVAVNLGDTPATWPVSVGAHSAIGEGSDTLINVENVTGGAGNDVILGDDNANILLGGAGSDIIAGGGGNDLLYGGDDKAADFLYAGAGDDVVVLGDGGGTAKGEAGNDLIYGGDGNDWLYGDDDGQPNASTDGNDTIFAGAGNDYIQGNGGDDKLYGEDGDDTIDGGAGNDQLYGGAGNDTLIGGLGNDTLDGGDGNDTFKLGADITEAGPYGPRSIDLGNGHIESLPLTGLAGTGDAIIGGAGYDTVVLDKGDSAGFVLDAFNPSSPTFSGIEEVVGTDGNDIILVKQDYMSDIDGGGIKIDGGAGNDAIQGGKGADTLIGGTGNDLISGGDGNDKIDGGDGNDRLYGGNGDDTIDGGNDDDIIEGGGGADNLKGGDGNDRITAGSEMIANGGFKGPAQVMVSEGSQTIALGGGWEVKSGSVDLLFTNGPVLNAKFPAGVNAIDMQGVSKGVISQTFQTVVGQTYTVTFLQATNPDALDHGLTSSSVAVSVGDKTQIFTDTADAGVNWQTVGGTFVERTITFMADDTSTTLQFTAGDDSAYGSLIAEVSVTSNAASAGATLDGGAGNDIITGGTGNDSIDGGTGDDLIRGGAGNDTINGGDGDDFISGGKGDDTLSGGAGNDTFSYSTGDGNDRIDGGDGNDTLHIAGSDTGSTFNINDVLIDGVKNIAVNIEDGSTANAATAGNYEVATTNVEEWVVDGGKGDDTFVVSGDLSGTGLAASTITINGGAGDDTLDVRNFASSQHIVFNGGEGGQDTIIFNADWKDATVTQTATGFEIKIGDNVYDVDGTEKFEFNNGTATVQTLMEAAPTGVEGTLTVAENSVAGTSVGTLVGTDVNGGLDKLTYAFVDANGHTSQTSADGKFVIDASTGAVTVTANASIDYETTPSLTETVRVTDVHNNFTDTSVSIAVTDVNEAPTAVNFSNAVSSIDENTVIGNGIKVAVLGATDDALGHNGYALTGADAGSFAIRNGNELYYTGSSPDFEMKSSYQVTVNVNDPTVGNDIDASKTFTLNVNDVNEAPTAVTFASVVSSVDENTVIGTGIKVAVLGATDDALGHSSYSLTGADAGSFVVRNGNELYYTGSSPDFETKAAYSVTVNVDDPTVGGNVDASKVFTLNVSDVNEAPTAVTFANVVSLVNENVAVGDGIKVAVLGAVDDALGQNGYSLSGADSASFTIKNGNELYYIGSSPDFETKSSYSVTVNVNDPTVGGNIDASKVFTLGVNDLPEAPPAVVQSGPQYAFTDGRTGEYPSGEPTKISLDLASLFSGTTAATTYSYEVVRQGNGTPNSGWDGWLTRSGNILSGDPDTNRDGLYVLKVTATSGGVSTSTYVAITAIEDGGLKYTSIGPAFSNDGDLYKGMSNVSAGAGDDVIVGPAAGTLLVGGSGSDQIHGGAGNDTIIGGDYSWGQITLDGAKDTNFISAGGGDDTIYSGGHDFILAGAGNDQIYGYDTDNLIDGGDGSDNLKITDDFDDTALGNAGLVNIEKVTLLGAESVNLSHQSENLIIVGSDGDDTIVSGSGNDKITGGEGADILSGGRGADIFVFNSGDSTINSYDVIKDFSASEGDKIALALTPTMAANLTATNNFGKIDNISVTSVKIVNGIATFYHNSTAIAVGSENGISNAGAILAKIDIGNGGATAAFAARIDNQDHTVIFQQGGDSINAGTDTLIDLAKITAPSSLATLLVLMGAASAIDPIILDLDHNGVALTSLDQGVQFDINADGHKDQIAWTAGSDGILALDVDGNGKIDNGSEIFSPHFAGGNYATGLAALATLDTNHDGKIDAADEAFSKLTVWQDLNHNGLTDAGELSSLADQHITSISLDAAASNTSINGQTILSEGSYTTTDGGHGSFVEVAFDTTLGGSEDGAHAYSLIGSSGDDVLSGAGGMYTISGGAGADTFVLDTDALKDVKLADVITDYKASEGDTLDVSKLLDTLLGHQATEAEALASVKTTVNGTDTVVSVNDNGSWHDVAVLQNTSEAVKILFDDKHDTTTAPHVG